MEVPYEGCIRRSAPWAGFIFCAAPCSCGDDAGPLLPDVSWSSEDFDFATDVDSKDMLCAGTLSFQQQFIDVIQEFFGQPVNGRKFTYYLFSLQTFHELFEDGVQGRYDDGRVFVKALPDLHEVTHAVVDLAIGNSHPFFNEGIAEVFRDRYGGNDAPGAEDVEEGLAYDGVREKLPGSLYGRAGHFMSYALETHGIEATVSLLARARPGDSPDMLRAAIATAFGMSCPNVLSDYENYPLCPHEQFRWPIAECEVGVRVEPVDRVWSIDANLDCKRADMLGTRVAEDWTYRTIDVPAAGSYRVSVSGEDGDFAFVEIGHCSPGCAPDKGLKIDTRETQTLSLRQGRYHVTLVGLQVNSGHLLTRIEPVDIDVRRGTAGRGRGSDLPRRREFLR